MTQTFSTDATNDLYLGPSGLLAVSTGADAARENCLHAAKTILNEMVLDQGEGLPYFEALWIGTPNVAAFESALRRRLAAVTDIVRVISLTTRQEGEILFYDASLETAFGTVAVNAQL